MENSNAVQARGTKRKPELCPDAALLKKLVEVGLSATIQEASKRPDFSKEAADILKETGKSFLIEANKLLLEENKQEEVSQNSKKEPNPANEQNARKKKHLEKLILDFKKEQEAWKVLHKEKYSNAPFSPSKFLSSARKRASVKPVPSAPESPLFIEINSPVGNASVRKTRSSRSKVSSAGDLWIEKINDANKDIDSLDVKKVLETVSLKFDVIIPAVNTALDSARQIATKRSKIAKQLHDISFQSFPHISNPKDLISSIASNSP